MCALRDFEFVFINDFLRRNALTTFVDYHEGVRKTVNVVIASYVPDKRYSKMSITFACVSNRRRIVERIRKMFTIKSFSFEQN